MIKTFLQTLQILSDEELDKIESIATVKKLRKGDYLIKEGSVAEELAYIQKGSLRSFYRNSNGDEFTYCISFENAFMTAFSSLISGTPTSENIQALTDTDLVIIKKKDLDELYNSGMNWLKVGKFFTEQQYIELENRIFSLQRKSAKERYEELFENHPDYIQLIPLQYLASYLGVTPRHLSRLRKEIAL